MCGKLKSMCYLTCIFFVQTQTLLGGTGMSSTELLMQGDTIVQELIVATSSNASTVSTLPLDLNTTNTIVANMIQALLDALHSNITQFPLLVCRSFLIF